MTPEIGGVAPEAPATQSRWFARTPLWARIAVPVVVLAGGTALIASVVAGTQPAATVDSACRSAIEDMLESRGHSDIDVSRSLRVTESDGAQRVSGTVTSVDGSGRVDHANVRCIVRVNGDSIRVVSARLSD